jgi:ribonuclease VapC
MVVDASAVLAIYFDEPEAALFRAALRDRGALMSPVNHWEVLARAHRAQGGAGAERAGRLVNALGVQVTTSGDEASRAAYEAFSRFGKGVGGPLNLGDCFAYALAEREGEGLLYKGDDFSRTDVISALD